MQNIGIKSVQAYASFVIAAVFLNLCQGNDLPLVDRPLQSSSPYAASIRSPVSEPVRSDPFASAASPVNWESDVARGVHDESETFIPYTPSSSTRFRHLTTLEPNWNVKVFGALQADMLFSTARAVASGMPFFLTPNIPEPENSVEIFARSSTLGALFLGPQVGGFHVGGVFLAALYDGSLIEDRYGFLPIQGFGELRNDTWRVAAGIQYNVFAPVSPNTLTFSSLLGAGNAGNNFPAQFRVERYWHPSRLSELTLQLAVSDVTPTGVISETPISVLIAGFPQPGIMGDNGWPAVEGRMAVAYGEEMRDGLAVVRPFELGFSAIGGQLRTSLPFRPNTVTNMYGLAIDHRMRLNDRWGLAGEVFTGEALGFQNGGALQSLNNRTLDGIRTYGVWQEVYCYLNPSLHTHWGAGFDDPSDKDVDNLVDGQIRYNKTIFANLIWDITRQVRAGIETTYRETDYARMFGLDSNNQGLGIQTQLKWAF